MKNNNDDDFQNNKFTRRKFLSTLGLTTAGLVFAPSIISKNINVYGYESKSSFLAQVAITEADNYERSLIKQKVQHLFESLGGISDVVKPGDKVAIKINLTGGSSWANHERLQGVDIRESMWTHPEVVRAVAELIIDSGVNANDIYFVEALWDNACYNNFGYLNVQQSLGAKLVNLNQKEPYSDFIDKEVGENHFFYNNPLRVNNRN